MYVQPFSGHQLGTNTPSTGKKAPLVELASTPMQAQVPGHPGPQTMFAHMSCLRQSGKTKLSADLWAGLRCGKVCRQSARARNERLPSIELFFNQTLLITSLFFFFFWSLVLGLPLSSVATPVMFLILPPPAFPTTTHALVRPSHPLLYLNPIPLNFAFRARAYAAGSCPLPCALTSLASGWA